MLWNEQASYDHWQKGHFEPVSVLYGRPLQRQLRPTRRSMAEALHRKLALNDEEPPF